MSPVLFRHLVEGQRVRLVIVAAALALWGFLLPMVYATFGADIAAIARIGTFRTIIELFSRFSGGDILSLDGLVGALGFVHPIAIALIAVYSLGFPIAAVAGERQRGTLEIVLARPIGRIALYGTVLAATVIFVIVCVTAIVAGIAVGAMAGGVGGELSIGPLLACWLNAVALHGALAAVGLAVAVCFDRLGTVLGIALGLTIAWYTMEFLGALWPTADWLRPWSPFHYLQGAEVLAGRLDPGNVVVLLGVAAAAIVASVVVFPRRDIAAPS